ncbi:MAG: hypothetical protein Q9160_009174 [Pyrenula sp. 1 TL-2023]
MSSKDSVTSEGEIFSSDSEKANRSLYSRNGNSIDRLSRPYHSSAPRSPALRPSTRRNSRSRSRSPYRASRGEKRRRDDDYVSERHRPDSRRFNTKYEGRYGDDKERRPTYKDLDSVHSSRSHLKYDDDRHNRKRPRTLSRSRSRSPFRHDRTSNRREDQKGGRNQEKLVDPRQDKRNRGSANRRAREQSVSERSTSPSVAQSSKPHAETFGHQITKTTRRVKNKANADRYVEVIVPRRDANGPACYREAGVSNDVGEIPADYSHVVDEIAEAEERRKKREALKAKYSTQATPLLVQALHTGSQQLSSMTEPNDTPITADSPANAGMYSILALKTHLIFIDTGPTSPQTSKGTSAPQSPAEFDFSQDDILARANAAPANEGDHEPSAADYDPTVDMQEERLRHDKRLFNEEVRAEDYDETQAEKKNIPIANNEPQAKKTKGEFDMFADEEEIDDDDMFAPALVKPTKVMAPETKAAKAMDANMLDNWDDPEGYYNTILGELIEARYHVQQNLGRGMFSSVVRALDTESQKLVAIKIVRNNDTMRKSGLKEISVLRDIENADPEDKKHMIRLVRSFDHKGHLCMVFENLSLNLREVLRKFGRDVGINLKAIRAYAQQLFLGLSLMRKCNLLHADLKPDNILVNDSRNLLKICDLGSASHVNENPTAPYLVSRFYRAPEIILGIPYDYAIDVWSIGCTLFELYTGKILFTGRNNNGMLRTIMECRGRFPPKLLRRGTLTHQYFDELLNFVGTEEDKLTGRMVTKVVEVKAKPVKDLASRIMPKGARRVGEEDRKELISFVELLERCLDLRPDRRITPVEALRHPFILKAK